MNKNFETAVKKYKLEKIVKKYKEKVKKLLELKPDLSPASYRDWIKMMPFFTNKEYQYLLQRKTPLSEKQLKNPEEIKERIKFNKSLMKKIKDDKMKEVWEKLIPYLYKERATELIEILKDSRLKKGIKEEDFITAVISNQSIEKVKSMLTVIKQEKKSKKSKKAEKKASEKIEEREEKLAEILSDTSKTKEEMFFEILEMCKNFTNDMASILIREIMDLQKQIILLKEEIDELKGEE